MLDYGKKFTQKSSNENTGFPLILLLDVSVNLQVVIFEKKKQIKSCLGHQKQFTTP